MGVAMTHPNGGPDLALRLDPPRATAAAGFDYFAIGVPGLEAIEELAARFTASGDGHAGVIRTPVGWVLPGTHDPDGHEVRFYTVPLELPDEAFLQAYEGEDRARHDAPPALAEPVERRRHAGRVVSALIAFGSTPALRCWSGQWWLASPAHGRPRAGTDVISRPRRRRVALRPPGDQVHFDWSPDGSEIAYVQVSDTGQTVMVTDLQGENPRPLVETFPPQLEGLMWDNPAWSRDGSEVAMVGYEGDPQNELPTRSLLVIVDVAGGELTVAGELVSAEGALHSFPRWSPDGDALVVNVDRFEGEDSEFVGSTVDIIGRSSDTWSAPESITDVGPFARVDWHPTEDLIVFGDHDIGAEESTDDPTNLYTIRPDGSELTQITPFGPGQARASQPTWTSDGRILFTHVTGDDDEVREIALIDADGSGLEIIVPADEIGDLNRPHPRMRPVR
jgi:dipeptidyl aminopeptidase/acylaminoacyl peptidase